MKAFDQIAFKMNILILGSGGREHAFTLKIAESPQCEKLFVAPGNAGTAKIAENVALNIGDHTAVGDFCLIHKIDMLVVGPEAPLVAGITDHFQANDQLKNIHVVGPSKAGAVLEGSKDYSKEFMKRHKIPTAGYATFPKEELNEGLEYLRSRTAPFVLKADGLAAGKGVLICGTLEAAEQGLIEMLQDEKFGEASQKVVIEEFLSGIELSVFVLTDGKNYKILPEAKDYKRIGEKDTGLNTGGMGAVSPVSFADATFMEKVESKVIKPTIQGLEKDQIDYKGFIFIGLMNVGGEPFVIEYNVRMGDPETQAVLPRIESDLLTLFASLKDQSLDQEELKISSDITSTVVLVAGGYPEAYKKGNEITGLDNSKDYTIFHAGTQLKDDKVLTAGGRVLAITGKGQSLQEALDNAYQGANSVCWHDIYYRKDIGQDLLALE